MKPARRGTISVDVENIDLVVTVVIVVVKETVSGGNFIKSTIGSKKKIYLFFQNSTYP